MAKKKKKRRLPGLNGAALADISFLFLIFFLLVATMDIDTGLPRQLPRPQPEDIVVEIERRNILVVNINAREQVFVNSAQGTHIFETIDDIFGRHGELGLGDIVREFVLNEHRLETLPEWEYVDFGPPIGNVATTGTRRVISMMNDATTSYRAFITVQNELVKTFNELRDEAARSFFNVPYSALQQEQREQIDRLYPQRISEAPPREFQQLQ